MKRFLGGFILIVLVGCVDNTIPLAAMDTGQNAAWDGEGENLVFEGTGSQWLAVPKVGASPNQGADSNESLNEVDGIECGVSDLVFSAEMHDDDGALVDRGYSTDSHRLWGRIFNPCDQSVSFETVSACLIEGWRIRGGELPSMATFPCSGEPIVRTIAAGQFIEQEVTPLHDLLEGTYEVTVVFGRQVNAYGARAEASLDYDIVNRAWP
jgi:hypothetical protein